MTCARGQDAQTSTEIIANMVSSLNKGPTDFLVITSSQSRHIQSSPHKTTQKLQNEAKIHFDLVNPSLTKCIAHDKQQLDRLKRVSCRKSSNQAHPRLGIRIPSVGRNSHSVLKTQSSSEMWDGSSKMRNLSREYQPTPRYQKKRRNDTGRYFMTSAKKNDYEGRDKLSDKSIDT